MKAKQHTIDFIFPLALFLVFTASALLVLLLAADTYKDITAQTDETYTARTALSYLREKVRHNDNGGNIEVTTLQGKDCFVIHHPYDDTGYSTYIYEDAGALKELFLKDGVTVNLAGGTVIADIKDYAVSQTGGSLFEFSLTDSNGQEYLASIRTQSTASEEEEALDE